MKGLEGLAISDEQADLQRQMPVPSIFKIMAFQLD